MTVSFDICSTRRGLDHAVAMVLKRKGAASTNAHMLMVWTTVMERDDNPGVCGEVPSP